MVLDKRQALLAVHMSEEAGEVVRINGKIMRYGLDSYSPLDPKKVTNQTNLEKEIADFLAMVELMAEEGMVDRVKIDKLQKEAYTKKTMSILHEMATY